MQLLENVSLKNYNTFGVDATARYFVEINTENDLQSLFASYDLMKNPFLILGGGSNVLLTQDFEGLVIKINIKGFSERQISPHQILVTSGAGENWHEFVIQCINKDYGGLENLSLIPGTVGAAPMQNIGAYGVEVKDTFFELSGFDIRSGKKVVYDKQSCQFGYRSSIFKHQLKDLFIITEVSFLLTLKNHALNTHYGAIQSTLNEKKIQNPTIQDISEAVIDIRKSKLPEPSKLGNAGSFFKNPLVSLNTFKRLKDQFEEIPGYQVSDQEVKVPAGWLIENCGWRGIKKGAVGIYPHHALVIVNYGGARGNEIASFAQEIQSAVFQKFGIPLQPEVNIV